MLNIKNNKLYFDDKLFIINEANSPESRLRDLHYPELDELNSYGVNTLYASCNAKESVYTLNPFINNSPSLGIDENKTTNWFNYLTKWVFDYPGKLHILHLLLSEKETHYTLTESQHKQMIDHLVSKFAPLAGYIIWDREELDAGKQAYINTYYSYLKQVDPVNIRGCHNNTNEDPWSGFENGELIQFLSLQEWEGNFGRRIEELTTGTNWAAYVSEKTGGFQPTDVSKVEPLIKCHANNSGIGFFISTKDHAFPDFQSQYKNLYLEADRVINSTTTNPPQPTNMIVGYSTQSTRSDFKAIPATIPTGNIFIEARQATAPVVFTLKKNGIQVVNRTENGLPHDMMGGSTTAATAYNAQAGNYELTVKDAVGTIVTSFTVGTATQPVLGCTDPAATNYNPSATQDDGSCIYTQPTLPEVIVDITANPAEVNLIIKVNGATR